jgi:hypothetical protein
MCDACMLVQKTLHRNAPAGGRIQSCRCRRASCASPGAGNHPQWAAPWVTWPQLSQDRGRGKGRGCNAGCSDRVCCCLVTRRRACCSQRRKSALHAQPPCIKRTPAGAVRVTTSRAGRLSCRGLVAGGSCRRLSWAQRGTQQTRGFQTAVAQSGNRRARWLLLPIKHTLNVSNPGCMRSDRHFSRVQQQQGF